MANPFSGFTQREDDIVMGDWRSPRQMLHDQTYDGHVSVHDDSMAEGLGLPGAPIEGPTHFSQLDLLAYEMFGDEWFVTGCVSSHFENMVIEGEKVKAFARQVSDHTAEAWAEKEDGDRVLTASLTVKDANTALSERLSAAQEKDPGELFIIDRLELGMTTGPDNATLTMNEHNGDMYPFSLAEKLTSITEPCQWYSDDNSSPWQLPVVPSEMLSVMGHRGGSHLPVRGPSVGLFIDLEVRRRQPVLVGAEYSVTHEVVAMGQSRRVESYWTRSSLVDDEGAAIADVLLHQGVFKASYEDYPTSTT